MELSPFSYTAAIAALAFLCIVVVYQLVIADAQTPKHLPWAGMQNEFFARTRVGIKFMKSYRVHLQQAYEEYSLRGETCIVKNLNEDPVILLPSKNTPWIMKQPQSVLSSHEALRLILKMDYTFPTTRLATHATHVEVIKQGLNRQMGVLTENIHDEIAVAFEETWGSDTQNWKDVCVFETMLKVISRAANRALVGLPMCRNQEYLDSAIGFSRTVLPVAFTISWFPKALRPVVGRLLKFQTKRYYDRLVTQLMPMVKERLELFSKLDPSEYEALAPNDYITWQINFTMRTNDPSERTAEMICWRILIVNFASIYTTNFICTNAIFNLVSAPPSSGFLEGLREEVNQALEEKDGVWSKAAVDKMHRVDSAVKETLRHSDFANLAMRRIAVKDVTTESGLKVLRGQALAVPSRSIMTDPTNYPDPYNYDAFRFSRPLEKEEQEIKSSQDAESPCTDGPDSIAEKESRAEREINLKYNMVEATRTSETYLSFGHGTHACPGRFLSVKELKLIIGNMVLKYEIEPLNGRKENWMVGQLCVPPMKETIRIRRRKDPMPSK